MQAELRSSKEQRLAISQKAKFQIFKDQLLRFDPRPSRRFVLDADAVFATDHTYYKHLVLIHLFSAS
jgi:hypothetical protein